MSSETQTPKDLVNKDGDVTKLIEWATEDVDSIEGMKELFGSAGVSYSSGEELTGAYKLVTGDEKQLFLTRIAGTPAFIVRFKFNTRDDKEFVTAYILVEGHGKFIVNDGAKSGIYGQLSEIYSRRVAGGWEESRACTGVDVPRGFVKNADYYYNTDTNKAIKKAEMDDFEKHPKNKRRLGHPTWKMQF